MFTNSGVQLVGTEAAQLSFNPQGTVTPNTLYNADPTKSNVGTITINFPHGGSYDLVSTNSIRSGKIAAYLELRDNTLVKAQAQIDQFAAVDVERAVGQDDRRHCRARVGAAAGRLRSRSRRDCSPATSFTSPTRTTPPASRTISRSCASTIRACCR